MSFTNNNNNNKNSDHQQQRQQQNFLRIVSWNVAGWTATAGIIRGLYDGKISTFLNNFHGTDPSSRPVDIFALQEVKGTGGIKKLRQDPVAAGACDSAKSGLTIPGWDTFWAHSEPQFKGFNGVAIFARTGLVVAADPAPLRVPELDAEGRCILGVTESCSVFSVYAPASRGEGRAELRRRFFVALGDAVERVRRDYGKPVVLCGDLNATYRPSDCHWTWRRFSFEKLRMKEGDEYGTMIVHWPRWMNEGVRRVLVADVEAHIELQKEQKDKGLLEKTANCNDDIINATRFAAKNNNGKSGENCFPREKTDEGQNDADDGDENKFEEETAAAEQQDDDDEHWWIDTFCNVDTTAWKSRRWYPVSQLGYLEGAESAFARSVLKHTHCDGKANLDCLFAKGLVDSLVEVHPRESVNKNLFTCFNQSRNERFSGVGQRIDYVFVDPELLVLMKENNNNNNLNDHEENDRKIVNENDANSNTNNNQQQQVALVAAPQGEFHSQANGNDWVRLMKAASSDGAFQPAPTDGGGLSKLTRQGCERAFNSVLPYSGKNFSPSSDQTTTSNAGVIYTAPQLSDHVAVFCDVTRIHHHQHQTKNPHHVKNIEELQNGATKNCKYTSTVRSISSFFSVAASSSANSSKNNSQSVTTGTTTTTTTTATILPQRRERKEQEEIEVIELD